MDETLIKDFAIHLSAILICIFFLTMCAYQIYRKAKNEKEKNLNLIYSFATIGVIIWVFILIYECAVLLGNQRIIIPIALLALCSIYFALKTTKH